MIVNLQETATSKDAEGNLLVASSKAFLMV